MKKVISKQSNYTVGLFIPKIGRCKAVVDSSLRFIVIPERLYKKHYPTIDRGYAVLETSFGYLDIHIVNMFGIRLFGKKFPNGLWVAISPNATKVIIGRSLIEELGYMGINLEYVFSNLKID